MEARVVRDRIESVMFICMASFALKKKLLGQIFFSIILKGFIANEKMNVGNSMIVAG